MSMFQPQQPQQGVHAVESELHRPFRFRSGGADGRDLVLSLDRFGHQAEPITLFSYSCRSSDECRGILDIAFADPDRVQFIGRLLMMFGDAPLIDIVSAAVELDGERLAEEQRDREEQERKHRTIELFARVREGRFWLDLERQSESKPDWSMRYDRRPERDRMCDWLRWQKDRFAEFVTYADEHGARALEQRLSNEMFETEARLKKEGKSAGGTRPLRMWRGA